MEALRAVPCGPASVVYLWSPSTCTPGRRWVLVPRHPRVRWLPEFEVRAARRTREKARMAGSNQCCSAPIERLPSCSDDDRVLHAVLLRSLTSAEMDAHDRRCKNAKASREGIEASEQAAAEKEAVVAKARRLTAEQARAARCLAGLPCTLSSSDVSFECNSSDSDGPTNDNPYVVFAMYSGRHGDDKGRSRRFASESCPVLNIVYILTSSRTVMSGDELVFLLDDRRTKR